MPPFLSKGSGKPTLTLQNGKTITLEVLEPAGEDLRKPIPDRPKKANAKTYTYPEYSKELYNLNAQTDQTYCNAISQFIMQDGAEADIQDFLTFMRDYGPRTSRGANHTFQTFASLCDVRTRAGSYCHYYSSKVYERSKPGQALDNKSAKQRYTQLSGLGRIRARTSTSSSPSTQGTDVGFDESQDVRSNGTGQLERETSAASFANPGNYPVMTYGNQFVDLSGGHHINDVGDVASQMTSVRDLAPIGGQDPANIGLILNPSSRSANNSGAATSYSTNSIASQNLASQALATLTGSASQELAGSSTFRMPSANSHPSSLGNEFPLARLYVLRGGNYLFTGWFGSSDGTGWTSYRIDQAPLDCCELLYFADVSHQFRFSGYLGDLNGRSYVHVGLNHHAGHAVTYHSGSTGGEYGNSSGGGGMSNAWTGSSGDGGRRRQTQDDRSATPPGYERAW